MVNADDWKSARAFYFAYLTPISHWILRFSWNNPNRPLINLGMVDHLLRNVINFLIHWEKTVNGSWSCSFQNFGKLLKGPCDNKGRYSCMTLYFWKILILFILFFRASRAEEHTRKSNHLVVYVYFRETWGFLLFNCSLFRKHK